MVVEKEGRCTSGDKIEKTDVGTQLAKPLGGGENNCKMNYAIVLHLF